MLLVLDNVSGDTVDSALPFLVPRPPGSLLLATSWYEGGIKALEERQIQLGQTQPVSFKLLSMAEQLVLQPQHAEEMMQLQIALSRRLHGLKALPHTHLTDLAHTAAAALRSEARPAYVPKVLSVSACFLGRFAGQQPAALQELLADLRAARDTVPAGQISAADSVFRQLKACYSQLQPTARQIFIDVAVAQQQQADNCSVNQLALWLSCRQADACTMEKARREV